MAEGPSLDKASGSSSTDFFKFLKVSAILILSPLIKTASTAFMASKAF